MKEMVQAMSQDAAVRGIPNEWEIVIGMEVHAQVISKSKLFSGASVAFGATPNSHVSLIDAAMPGMLPVLNRECVRQAIRTGYGLNAQINLVSVFERKHYFYPDLPQGYQITQYKQPIVGEGQIILDMSDGRVVKVGIDRLHLEQDAGKLIHDVYPGKSCLDINRAGIALMEIVSKPDMRSADEAKAYLMKLRTIMRYLGTCDGNMEEGSLRADVNLSVRKRGAPLGVPCEIKNINSLRFIGQAIEYEARRQIAVLEAGERLSRETRLFDRKTGETRPMRSKEDSQGYRYFSDPDILPLKLSKEYVDEIRRDLPELPDEKKARFINVYGLKPYDASVLVADHETASFFERVVCGRDPRTAASWVINELFGRLNSEKIEITASPIVPEQLGSLIDLVSTGVISGKIAKDVFEILWKKGGDPLEIVESCNLKQVTDRGEIERIVNEILSANADKVAQLEVKPSVMGWLIGQVIAASGGKANPQLVRDILKEKTGCP